MTKDVIDEVIARLEFISSAEPGFFVYRVRPGEEPQQVQQMIHPLAIQLKKPILIIRKDEDIYNLTEKDLARLGYRKVEDVETH